RPGDLLYLATPLGTGLILTAARGGRAEAPGMEAAIDSILRLNHHPSHIAAATGVRAMSDVTGFGLLGHADEMARLSAAGMELYARAMPALPGAMACIGMGIGTGGAERNRAYVSPRVRVEP